MADCDETEELENQPASISDTGLDDAAELDYEPSEPSADSIKNAVSDDEEEGEAGDSENELKRGARSPTAGGRLRQTSDLKHEYDEGVVSGDGKSESNSEDDFSGPEEGEVDELEEGEVKDESDDASENRDGHMKCDQEKSGGIQRQQRFSFDSKPQEFRGDLSMKQRGDDLQNPEQRKMVTAPSSSTSADNKATDNRTEDAGICKFYVRGQCTWGSFCKFLHSSGGDGKTGSEPSRRPQDAPTPTSTAAPVPLMALKADLPLVRPSARPVSPPSESAWERGLKQARERIKRATEKKEVDPDFERKRMTMPLGPAVEALEDDSTSPLVVGQLSPSIRSAPSHPLANIGRSGDRFPDDIRHARAPEPIQQRQRQSFGREPYGDFGNGDRPAYVRRQPPIHPVAVGHGDRDSTDDPYLRPHPLPAPSRRPESQDRFYGADRRDHPIGNAPPPVGRERNQFRRDDYSAASVVAHRSSQDIMSPPPASEPYYHQRNSTSVDYGGQHADIRRVGDRDERDAQKRRLEPEPQGWEYRRSPPAYYRDRDPEFGRPPEAGRRSYDPERQFRGDVDNRRPPMPQTMQPKPNDHIATADNRNLQQQHRPPNYHYYRTLQQQQQFRNRNRATGEQERKPGGDYNKDREKERNVPKGRNEYNYHFYSTRDRQMQQQQQGSGRQLPYERPSFTRQEHRGQWRDPWRRSTSPGSRRGAPDRHSSLSKRLSRDGDRSASNSPVAPEEFDKRRRRTSGSSSISRSSASSRSVSSGAASISRKAAAPRKLSVLSPSSSIGSPRRHDSVRHPSGSPLDGDRNSRHIRSSKDRSPLHISKKEPSDVASRAAAKALGTVRDRSFSPLDVESPSSHRRRESGSVGGRHSSAGSRNSGQVLREQRHQALSPPRGQSPEPTGRVSQTKPLSPPPPAPFLANATIRMGGKDGKAKQRSEQPPRKPIKMTIANKSKVKTNIYEHSLEEDDDSAPVPASGLAGDASSEMIPLSPVDSPRMPADEGPAAKRIKTVSESGSGSGGENKVISRREELLRQLRAVEHAIDAKRKKDKGKP